MLHPAPLRKLASHNATFKRTFIRGCTDRLREIEVRLDHGCSGRWLNQLDQCEDMSGVAKLLLPLQRRTQVGDLDNRWLEELISSAPDALEDQQAELCRRLMQRLEEIDRSVPLARKPADMLGEVVLKHFEGHGMFMGTIVEYDENTGFRLQAPRQKSHKNHPPTTWHHNHLITTTPANAAAPVAASATPRHRILQRCRHHPLRRHHPFTSHLSPAPQYDDGDTEDVSIRDLRQLLPRATDPSTGEPEVSSGESEASHEAEMPADAGELPGAAACPPPVESPIVSAPSTAPVPRKKQLMMAMMAAEAPATPAPVLDVPKESLNASKGKAGKGSAKAGTKSASKGSTKGAGDGAAACASSSCHGGGSTGGEGLSQTSSGSKRALEDDELAQLPPGASHDCSVRAPSH